MADKIIDILEQTGMGAVLVTFIVSMMPVVELRGAIPVGISLGLGSWIALIVSIIGNMIPVPFIILFIRNIFVWMRKRIPKLERLIDRIEKNAWGKRERIRKYRFLGLFIFVAIPLPGTGAWTGALIAALLDIRLKLALPAIFGGVIVAGFLITGIAIGFTSLFS